MSETRANKNSHLADKGCTFGVFQYFASQDDGEKMFLIEKMKEPTVRFNLLKKFHAVSENENERATAGFPKRWRPGRFKQPSEDNLTE